MAAQLGVEIDGPPSLFPPAEPAAVSRICTASRHLHRHYRMRRKRRAARRRPPSGGPQFNVKTLGGPELRFELVTISDRMSDDRAKRSIGSHLQPASAPSVVGHRVSRMTKSPPGDVAFSNASSFSS